MKDYSDKDGILRCSYYGVKSEYTQRGEGFIVD